MTIVTTTASLHDLDIDMIKEPESALEVDLL